jgi:hypothetical protein|uniref:Uncharacterized protein n=1 Tax=Caudovirales sp. ctTqA28 TaxID=2826775 RepID=A0A8S5MDL2_9CAUD|nr:MAG TPA: hypothetical protein [Caudovirales sp. ctTqA28]
MVKETSWKAYQDILRGGIAATQAEKVLQAINYYPEKGVTRAQLSVALGMPINSVCGRVNELLKAEVIYVSGTGKCPVTGRTVEVLKVVEYE